MGKLGKISFNGGNLLGISKWTEDLCLRKKKLTPVGLSAKLIGLYPRSQVSVYRTIGRLVVLQRWGMQGYTYISYFCSKTLIVGTRVLIFFFYFYNFCKKSVYYYRTNNSLAIHKIQTSQNQLSKTRN